MKTLENIIAKLELKREVNIHLDISKEAFFLGLKKKMKSESESPLFSGFEIFSSDDTPFFGEITDKGFTLRSRRVAGKSVRHVALAKGTIQEHDKGLSVLIEINAFRGIYSFIISLLVPLYLCLFFLSLSIGIFKMQVDALLGLIFIPLHGVFMIGVPMFLLRKAARILDQNLVSAIESIGDESSLS